MIFFSVTSFVFAQESKKTLPDSLTVNIPNQSEKQLIELDKQAANLSNPDWVKEELARTQNMSRVIVGVILDANGISASKSAEYEVEYKPGLFVLRKRKK